MLDMAVTIGGSKILKVTILLLKSIKVALKYSLIFLIKHYYFFFFQDNNNNDNFIICP